MRRFLLLATLMAFGAFDLTSASSRDHYIVNDYYEDSLPEAEDRDRDAQTGPESLESNSEEQSQPQIFAVLVAGSSGYGNYRHQADVCHAYQILARNGVPDSNIIVMMVDDIANSPENPTPGIIINRPNGSDVYDGVPKDYVGKDVTPENFLAILRGDSAALRGVGSGKVLRSGPQDHVFINFVDHGAPGLVAFPESELHAQDLSAALRQMHANRQYKRLVFYLEACESGSMFDNNLLPPHMNIFATTAANGEESSYAVYYDAERRTYLGDVYSVNWMEDADSEDLTSETLQRQYMIVKKETNTSHVMEFGDGSLKNLAVGLFLGEEAREERIVYEPVPFDPVDNRDVPRLILEKRLGQAESVEERREVKQKLNRLHKLRKLVSTQFIQILNELTAGDTEERTRLLKSRSPLTNYDCYQTVTKYYSAHCFSIARNPYTMSKLYILVNICEAGWRAADVVEAMASVCREYDGVNAHEYAGMAGIE